MIIDGGHLKGFDALTDVASNGSTLLDYYRYCMTHERRYENPVV
jgi:hypothetical protein